MSDATVVVLFVAFTGLASLGVWWLGFRRNRRDRKVARTPEAIRAREHRKAA